MMFGSFMDQMMPNVNPIPQMYGSSSYNYGPGCSTSQQPPSFNSSSEPPDSDDNNTAYDSTFQ